MEFVSTLGCIALLSAVICACCFIKRKQLLQELNDEFAAHPYFEEPNNDGDDISLTTVNGFGSCFQGTFREANIGEHKSYVTYHSTILLFLIFPKTPYRVVPVSGKWASRPSWRIIGSVTDDKRERQCIKYRFYGLWAGAIAVFCLIMMLLFCRI